MSYVDGFLLAVPTANRDVYREHAEQAWPMFREFGALSMVEGWGDDVPDGKINSINSAVMRKADETALFSWVTWPDKATRAAGWQKMMASGPPEGAMQSMPFDGSRLVYGGFETLLGDVHAKVGYVDGTVMPVPADKRDAYTAASKQMADLFMEHGAISVVDCWGDDLPEGKVNDFHGAVLRKPDEAVVFSWINWKDKAARDAGWEKLMADARMQEFGPHTVGVDMSRMIFGSFTPLVDV
ncbi:MAG: DUF1428 domain-containing protein [Pannonibacter indicus]